MIVTVTLNPAIDRTLEVNGLKTGGISTARLGFSAAGGKGINVLRGVTGLGVPAIGIGILGGGTGRLIDSYRKDEGLDFRYVEITGESRICYSLIDNGVNTIINESGPAVTADEVAGFLTLYKETVKGGDILILSGSAADGFGDDIYRIMVENARKKGAITILDAKGGLLSNAIEARPEFVKINKDEFCALTGSADKDIVIEAGKLTRLGIKNVVITDGARPTLAVTRGVVIRLYPPEVDAINHWGCGDAACAGIAAGISNGLPLREALKLGIAAGTANSMTYGAGFIKRDDVTGLIDRVVLVEG